MLLSGPLGPAVLTTAVPALFTEGSQEETAKEKEEVRERKGEVGDRNVDTSAAFTALMSEKQVEETTLAKC